MNPENELYESPIVHPANFILFLIFAIFIIGMSYPAVNNPCITNHNFTLVSPGIVQKQCNSRCYIISGELLPTACP